MNYNVIINFIRSLYKNQEFVPLHAPIFIGNEKKYLNNCIDSTYVSYVGNYVVEFEKYISEYTQSKFSIALVNGTAALHIALKLVGVKNNDEVLTQSLTFVATTNAISYLGAKPTFIDSDLSTLGMSAESLFDFLDKYCIVKTDGFCYNKETGKKISACVPVHVFGHPVEIDKIVDICNKFNIPVVEDAAESLGSKFKNIHTGKFGKLGILSFNGNKIVTTGGGGMIITDDEDIAKRAKYITTTAKVPHKWEFFHDEIGYNYRMPNLNAAIGLAQMEKIDVFIKNKRELALIYNKFFDNIGIDFFIEKDNCFSNYWLNTILLKNRVERDKFLLETNNAGIMTRPAWTLMNKLPIYSDCFSANLNNAKYLEDRIVNIPSSIRI
ncbi:MAG: aminotransferase DegT [Bacteroidetes bacterium GWE2_29_8]|nr:MAG: aminotransferase DegT [Bacteroidetes bacterium GWE2_29_8]OFY20038.1 MAG: aminotransferase DegT [Bacteroidetes bacterium GWF2_29_10]